MRVGLALSGGSLKAAAHIGVLTALQKIGIKPHFIAGTSAGSFVGTLYAHGYTLQELERLIDDFPGPRLLDYGFPIFSSIFNLVQYRLFRHPGHKTFALPRGLLHGKQLERYFRKKIGKRKPQMPYAIVATDLYTGNPIVFSNDDTLIRSSHAVAVSDVVTCLRGSCALPGILTPVRFGPWLLADGALRHYVPVEVLRKAGCNKIIVVNLNQVAEDWYPHSFVQVITRSFDILLEATMEDDLQGRDLFVLQPDIRNVTWVSFEELDTCLAAGKEVVQQNEKQMLLFLNSAPPVQSRSAKKEWPLI